MTLNEFKYVIIYITATGPDGREWGATLQALNPLHDHHRPSYFWFLLGEAAKDLSQYVGVYGTWKFQGVSWNSKLPEGPPGVRLPD